MSERRMFDLFTRLCEVPSPTGQEREVTDLVASELRSIGLEVTEDECAEAARAGAGNLLCRIAGTGDGWVMFDAHLDTVPHPEPIEVVEQGGLFTSAGETILGADNKAAVAVLLEMARRYAESPPPSGVELLFTVAEEHGLRGAHAFDTSSLRAKAGFVLDHASPIGEVITAAPTYKLLEATFRGQTAHAGLVPEEGHSAIAAAARAVAEMELGRLDADTTANVGTISGGSAANVVPGECRVVAEARSIEMDRVTEVLGAMIEACTWGAGEEGCDVDIEVSELFRGYRIGSTEPSLRLAEAGLRACGIEPLRRHTGGGSDANALRLGGFDAILLANGTEANHTPQESVSEVALTKMLGVCEAIVAAAGSDGSQ